MRPCATNALVVVLFTAFVTLPLDAFSPKSITQTSLSRVSPLFSFLPPSWDRREARFNDGRYIRGGLRNEGWLGNTDRFEDEEEFFGFPGDRLMGNKREMLQTFVAGAVTGSLTQAPICMFQLLSLSTAAKKGDYAQLEFDTYSAAFTAGFFAIIYSYCVNRIRQDEYNFGPQLYSSRRAGIAVAGTFALVRTLARIHVPTYCTAAPLKCGAPLGAIDWNLIMQFAKNGLESVILFGVTALVMDNLLRTRRPIGRPFDPVLDRPIGVPPPPPPPPPQRTYVVDDYEVPSRLYDRPAGGSRYQNGPIYGREDYGRDEYGGDDYGTEPWRVYDQDIDRY